MVLTIATASPTAFVHDIGKWDNEAKVVRLDLGGLIIIFLDQPHYTLMERLRPLLSHDTRQLLYKITDKSKRGALRTKNVVLTGFASFWFCAAKLSLDEQERTRVFILSPETSSEKLEESLRLAIAKVGDREGFKSWVESHPRRKWLSQNRSNSSFTDQSGNRQRSGRNLQKIPRISFSTGTSPPERSPKNSRSYQGPCYAEFLAQRKVVVGSVSSVRICLFSCQGYTLRGEALVSRPELGHSLENRTKYRPLLL